VITAIKLHDQKQYNAIAYDSIYYIEQYGHYLILEQTVNQDISNIDKGFLYCHYMIDGIIYEATYTNDAEWYVSEFLKKPQPTLFDY
jgi:hypothetical protein